MEEEGLTDIIRKKTKLPSSGPVNLKAGQSQSQSQVSNKRGHEIRKGLSVRDELSLGFIIKYMNSLI